ncbi:MAG: hypothetical protein K8R89_03295 [Anaerolineae bacterium]|nr:hypothetical protein [Anaerolineae bacterium]
MAKKRRTPQLSATQLYRPSTSRGINQEQAPLAAAKNQEVAVAREEDLAAEYSYVLKDLKHIGVIALVMLVLLIVLALILV